MNPVRTDQTGTTRLLAAILACFAGVVFLLPQEMPVFKGINQRWAVWYAERQLTLEKDSPDPGELLATGWAYYNLGALDKAKSIMEQAAFIPEGQLSAQYCLGLISLQRGEYDVAVYNLEAVAAKRPGYVAALAALGQAYFELGRLDEAETRFREVLEREPGNDAAFRWLERIRLIQDFSQSL